MKSSSYPEGNFGGNQQPGGSIGLSPLNPDQTNDLHVSIAASLHQGFPWLRPVQAKFTTFRVLTDMLLLKSSTSERSADGATYVNSCELTQDPTSAAQGYLHFNYAFEFQHSNTRRSVRLLGPCFKTGR